MINLQQANLNFGGTSVLRDCTLKIEQGQQVALIGPSGSGKSSLLKVLATEYSIDSGSVEIGSKHLSELSTRQLKALRCQIGYIPQDLALVPNLKVSQNVILGRVGQRNTLGTIRDLLLPSHSSLEDIYQLLKEVGITEKIFHRTDSLSGGQQQRVAIARTLYQQASLLLADEPVSAVDPSRAHSLLKCLTEMATNHKLTLLCSLHNLDYAKAFFPRLIGMRAGKVVFDGPSASFTDQDFSELYSLSDA